MNISLTELMYRLKEYRIKRKPTINSYCMHAKIIATKKDDKWFVSEEYAQNALHWRTNACYIEDLIDELLTETEIHSKEWINNRRNLTHKISKYYEQNNEYSILFEGNYIAEENRITVKKIIENERDSIFKSLKMITISEASELVGISEYKLKKLISSGDIDAEMLNSKWYISAKDVERYINRKASVVSVYAIAEKICAEIETSFNLENRFFRNQLNNYIQFSNLGNKVIKWEDTRLHENRRNAIYLPVEFEDELYKIIYEYIKNYSTKVVRLDGIWSDEYWKTHPITKQLLVSFSETKKNNGIYVLAEGIINCCRFEIFDSSNEEVLSLNEYIALNEKFEYKKYLVDFIGFVKNRYDCVFTFDFSIQYSKKHSTDSTIPYNEEQFIRFAVLVFNDRYIKNNDLFGKAIVSSKSSYVWLYSIWHYFAAWRKSDIDKNIPIIDVPYEWEELNRICLDEDSSIPKDFALRLESEINNAEVKPSKTQEVQNSRYLIVKIPTSLLGLVGRIYMIFAKHESELHINRSLNYSNFYFMFGDDYTRIFGQRVFSNRRGNKAYMNNLKSITELRLGKHEIAYRVTSLARAHVEPEGGLSTTTSKYLINKMDGYDKDEILIRLFESGFSSFIIKYLLEILYGKKFEQLNFQEQQELIQRVKLTPYKANAIIETINDSYIFSKKAVDYLLADTKVEMRSKRARDVLENLCNHSALTDARGVSCLALASGKPCQMRYKVDCISCKFKVFEIAFFYSLLEEVQETFEKMNESKMEGSRMLLRNKINKQLIPSIYEILACAKSQLGFDVSFAARRLLDLKDAMRNIHA